MGTCLDLENKVCVAPRAAGPYGDFTSRPASTQDASAIDNSSAADLRFHALLCGHGSRDATRVLPLALRSKVVAGIVPFVHRAEGVFMSGVAFNPQQVRAQFIQHRKKTFQHSWELLGQRGALINGGFFGLHGAPMGLLIANGQQLAPAEHEGPYSALFTINNHGEWELHYLRDAETGQIKLPADLSPYQLALQAGPMIIEPGGKRGVPPPREEPFLNERSVLVKTRDNKWLLIVAHVTDLYSLQNALLKMIPNVDAAMALDGGPSSGLAVESFGVMVAPVTPIPVSLHVSPLK